MTMATGVVIVISTISIGSFASASGSASARNNSPHLIGRARGAMLREEARADLGRGSLVQPTQQQTRILEWMDNHLPEDNSVGLQVGKSATSPNTGHLNVV